MKANTLYRPLLWVAGLLCLVSASCTRSADTLSLIPADAAFAAIADLDELCRQAGIDLAARDPRPVNGPGDRSLELLKAVANCPGVHTEDMGYTISRKNNKFLFLRVDDEDAVREATGRMIDWTRNGAYYMAYMANKNKLYLGEGCLWCVANGNLQDVKDLKSSARQRSIASLDGVAGVLRGDAPLKFAVVSGMSLLTGFKADSAPSTPLDELEWTVGSLTLAGIGGSVDIQAETTTSTGARWEAVGLQDINPAVLAYVPASMQCVAAIGIDKSFDWTPVTELAALAGGFQAGAMAATVTPYLASIDGTVLLAADLVTGEGRDILDTNFILLAHMPRRRIGQLVDMVGSMATSAGIKPRQVSQGVVAIPQYGRELYIGEVDGYLTVATVLPQAIHSNSLAPLATGKEVAVRVQLPASLTPTGTALVLEASMAGAQCRVKLSAPGTTEPVIKLLLPR